MPIMFLLFVILYLLSLPSRRLQVWLPGRSDNLVELRWLVQRRSNLREGEQYYGTVVVMGEVDEGSCDMICLRSMMSGLPLPLAGKIITLTLGASFSM